MRLIATFQDIEKARRLSAYLKSQGIVNELDSQPNHDWGSDAYGIIQSNLWIIDEDQVENAQTILNRYQDSLPPTISKKSEVETYNLPDPPFAPPIQQPLGYVTFYLLLACTMIYMVAEWSSPTLQLPLPKLPINPIASSPTKKGLMYDWPQKFEIVDELVARYGLPALLTPNKLPLAGQELFSSVNRTPMWEGVYPLLVETAHGKRIDIEAPLFEKVKEGEVWRLFTPILMHADIFHLIFNMLWLIVLGRQMELRLGPGRLLFFIAISALFSNTAQYLMSGANFIGFSGVLCAMLAFIWQRQLIAPWEGYQLQKPTIKFMFIFIGGMAILQVISFTTEVLFGSELSPGIANTAHISGLLIGYLMSKVSVFKLN